MQADNLWREDQTIRATNIFVGTARDSDSLEDLGVTIVLQVKLPGMGKPLQVSAVIPPRQAVQIADAIYMAARDSEFSE